VGYLPVAFLDQLPVEYDRLRYIINSIFDVQFGIWRTFEERAIRRAPGAHERQLEETLSRLENMRKLARQLDQHPAAVVS
jgi:hypothetical protein